MKIGRADRGTPAFGCSSLKTKNNPCSPLHSAAADNWRGALSEGNGGACRRMHETNHFLSGTLAGIDKPGVHLDSPIKTGK